MKIWIIYNKTYETNGSRSPLKMCNSAQKFGLESKLLYIEYFSICAENGREEIYYKNEKVTDFPDVAIIRCYQFEIMHALEKKGVKLLNSSQGSRICRDKYATHKIANSLNIPQPKTIFTKNYDFNFLSKELSLPFVMKDNTGAKGSHVYLIENEEALNKILNDNKDIVFIFQEYIKNSKGMDVRAYIVGNEIVGCIKRTSANGDFRANISLGGEAILVDIPQKIKNQALALAKVLDLKICSVDFLIDGEKYLFCEANSNAAFSGFFRQGFVMQDKFMEFIKKHYV